MRTMDDNYYNAWMTAQKELVRQELIENGRRDRREAAKFVFAVFGVACLIVAVAGLVMVVS